MLKKSASESKIGVSNIMGLLDRLKKKSSSTESSTSEDSEQSEFEDNESVDDEEDLFMESDSEEDLDEFDSLELENPDNIPSENQIKSSNSKSKSNRGIIIGLLVSIVFVIASGLGIWLYLSNRTFPMAEELTKRFFKALSKGKFNTAYSMMDKPYRDKISDDDFRLLLRASAYYFDKINKVDFHEENFESFGDISTLVGSIEYVGKASGEFELKFILRKLGKQDKLFITGFQLNSEERRKREEKASHKAVIEFLGTFSKERESVFERFSSKTFRDVGIG